MSQRHPSTLEIRKKSRDTTRNRVSARSTTEENFNNLASEEQSDIKVGRKRI
jgi:hypothetical protein